MVIVKIHVGMCAVLERISAQFLQVYFLTALSMAIFMFPGGLVQWLQNVPCYLHEVIGRRPRFGHHTGYETSKKPIYRSKYTFKEKRGVSLMHGVCLLLSKGGG